MSIKLLTISRSSWNNNNGIGNTFSSLFEGWEKGAIANLYCRSEMPDNNICSKYYSITDAQLVRSLISVGGTAGSGFELEENAYAKKNKKDESNSRSLSNSGIEQKRERFVYDFFKIYRSNLFLILHELLWLLGRWKSSKLNEFLDEVNPDIVFMPAFQSRYAHRLLWYVQQRTCAKIILFHADDYLTLHQHSWSPFFWINRLLGKRAIQKTVQLSSLNYCISQKQVDEYQRILKKRCKVLFKCGDFEGDGPVKKITGEPIKLVYTGNIGDGRWETLAKIGAALIEINKCGVKSQLDIYTLTPLTNKMEKKLNDGRNIFLKGSLSASQVKAVQKASDILVHVESFKRKHLLTTRLSFSTKIVDYLHQARCIFAVGSRECASIDYIEANNAGIVATNEADIFKKLQNLINEPSLILEYGYKAYACGSRNHQQEIVKGILQTDMLSVVNNHPLHPD